jgi:hypothetical protein
MEREMGEVTFCCPKTGKDVRSGFRALPAELKSLPKDAKINLRGLACGDYHEFRIAEAREISLALSQNIEWTRRTLFASRTRFLILQRCLSTHPFGR